MKAKLLFIIIFTFSTEFLFSQSGWISHTIGGPNITLKSVFFLNDDTGWIVGYMYILDSSIVIKTTNGGLNWYSVQVPFDSVHLESIYFIDENEGWMCGDRGSIIKTTNSGVNWSIISLNNSSFYSINFPDRFRGFAVDGNFNVVERTTNGGNNWDSIIVPNVSRLWDVKFINTMTGWVIGTVYQPPYGTGFGIIRKSTNSGINWIAQSVSSKGLTSVFALDSNYLWATGADGYLVRTTNSGNNWISDKIYSSNLYSVYFVNRYLGWSAGWDGKIFKTTNSGLNWIVQSTGITTVLFSIFFSDSLHGWCVGGSYILRTTNGGEPIGIKPISSEVPASFSLSQNYPNPFNPVTKIKFDIPPSKGARGMTSLIVYDALGREIAILVNEQLYPGTYEVEWDASNYPSGVYFYKLTAGDYTETKKMVLIK